jgi:PBP1b-binding outer membrane lipoprotein LpoB
MGSCRNLRILERQSMKKTSVLLLGLVALASATAAFAGPDLDVTQRQRQVAQAKTAPVDPQQMMAQCQEMMKSMPMDMHSGAMGMSQGSTTMHGMASAESPAPAPADLKQLYRGQ